MIWLRSFFFLIVGSCFGVPLLAQNFGGNPGSIRWRQVNTDAVKVVFPKGMDSAANRIATVTELLSDKYRGTLGNSHRKISIVLQPNNTLSNAYVQLGPWRSEFYLTAPQNPFELGSQRWADNLAIHEFRHVEQYSNFNVGLSKFMSVLLGQQGQAFANAVSVPDWFFEGDAVWNETAFSRQGRGRLPEFFNAYKSLAYQGRNYSYMKLRNGSLKNFVPNHYDLGYLLVAYGREKYGDSVWLQITQDAARFKGLFYPLQNAVKRHTGLAYPIFVQNAMAYYQGQWNKDTVSSGTAQFITPSVKRNVVNYKYAYPTEDSGVIALKTSYKRIPIFVRVQADGSEQKIAVKDIGYDDYFSYKNGRIIYTATRPDARWDNRDYSIIRLLDVNTKTVTTLSVKSKYFSPDISADGQQIVVVKADPTQTCKLHLLDVTGNIVKEWTADSSLFYSHPKFTADGKNVIVAARQPNGFMGWMEWNTVTNESRWLLQPDNRMIGLPVVEADTLFYTGTVGSSDGLYGLDLLHARPPVLVSSFKTGIYQGFEKNGKIIGSTFTADGYRLASFSPHFSHKGLLFNNNQVLADLYVPNTISGKQDVLDIATRQYTSSKYRKSFRLFNFHSWQPEISESDYSFAILGENVLSTLYSKAYYTYNTNEKTSSVGISEIFGGWYVQPYINASYTWNRPVSYNADTTFYYNQSQAGIGLQLPLNLSFGKEYRYLTLTASANTQNVRWTGLGKGLLQNSDFNYWNARLSYSSQIQQAAQHIYPHFAYTLLADYRSAINKYTGHQVLLSGYLYLPGLLASHSLVLSAAYQGRDTMQQVSFSNSFPFSRGYTSINYPRMYRLSANYHFPLLYPDWGFGQMLYFRRIRANVFYDYTSGKSLRTGNRFPFSTAGSEVYFDTRWWNQLPVTFGFRYSRLLDKYSNMPQLNQWEFILPINLLPR
jgi:hypothetical protein